MQKFKNWIFYLVINESESSSAHLNGICVINDFNILHIHLKRFFFSLVFIFPKAFQRAFLVAWNPNGIDLNTVCNRNSTCSAVHWMHIDDEMRFSEYYIYITKINWLLTSFASHCFAEFSVARCEMFW